MRRHLFLLFLAGLLAACGLTSHQSSVEGWMYNDPARGLGFITWAADGSKVSGTIQVVTRLPDGTTKAETTTFDGVLSDGHLHLNTVSGGAADAKITGDLLTFSGSLATGGFETVVFTRATLEEFNAAVDSLKQLPLSPLSQPTPPDQLLPNDVSDKLTSENVEWRALSDNESKLLAKLDSNKVIVAANEALGLPADTQPIAVYQTALNQEKVYTDRNLGWIVAIGLRYESPTIRIGQTNYSTYLFWLSIPDGAPISLMGLIPVASRP
jgi:hypothetical protein